jgi:acid phosphatase class B
LEFVNDSHADLNPEGSALMLDGKPATSKVVKAASSNTLRLTATNADAAATVAKIQSTLDGAIQACKLVGIDPRNVAKVAELQDNLEVARAIVLADPIDNSVDFTISRVVLHKRKHNKRS